MDGKHTKSETQRKEVKVVRGHAMKAYGGNRSMSELTV